MSEYKARNSEKYTPAYRGTKPHTINLWLRQKNCALCFWSIGNRRWWYKGGKMNISVADAVQISARSKRVRWMIPGIRLVSATDAVSKKPKRIPETVVKSRASARISPIFTPCSSKLCISSGLSLRRPSLVFIHLQQPSFSSHRFAISAY